MAVDKSPYEEWSKLKSNSDYRSTDSQMNSLVRQQLSKDSFLRTSNRVNPGPQRNKRARIADSKQQIPHPLGSQDLWGWQKWAEESNNLTQSNLAENLLEVKNSSNIPGVDYSPLSKIHGASS
jgi:hypothetical protein